MKLPAVLFILAFALNACQESSKRSLPEEKNDEKAYLPVGDFIRNELKAADSLPVGILKRETVNDNPLDSVFIQPAEFHQLAQSFLPEELNIDRFQRSFSETSFMDETTATLTFTYHSIDSTSSVRRVDVLILPRLDLDKIKSIYIEKAFAAGDTIVDQKMYWKGGQSFQINTSKSLNGTPVGTQQVKVIWDPMKY